MSLKNEAISQIKIDDEIMLELFNCGILLFVLKTSVEKGLNATQSVPSEFDIFTSLLEQIKYFLFHLFIHDILLNFVHRILIPVTIFQKY